MVINSLKFIYFIVPLFFLYYFFSKSKYQNLLLLTASYIFYGIADVKLLLLLIAASVIVYLLGIHIEKYRSKFTLSLGIVGCVGLLLYFKYLNFFIASFHNLINILGLQSNEVSINLIAPLGISFFTFKLISYLVDLYNGKLSSTPNFVNFATYISFFPTILSGPIDKSPNFLKQLEYIHSFEYQQAVNGLKQILWGMFKKMVIADNLASILTVDYTQMNAGDIIMTSILYSIQIYTDFSGYSDMAIGVGKLFGFNIEKNFSYPYFSRNVAEFWRRWHISLLSWFREYIYIPLGGSKCSKIKMIRNTFIIFIVSGLWHGANWTFIIWGLYHAMLFLPILLNKNKKKLDSNIMFNYRNVVSIGITFTLITIGWMIFRSNNMESFVIMIKQIYLNPNLVPSIGLSQLILPVILILFMFVLEWIGQEREFPLLIVTSRKLSWFLYVVLCLLIIYYQGISADFIYFKF